MTNKIWEDVEAFQNEYKKIAAEQNKKQKENELELKKQSLELPEVKEFIDNNFDLFLTKAPINNYEIPQQLAEKFLALSDEAQDGFLNYLYDYIPKADPHTEYYEGQAYYNAKNNWETAKRMKNNLLIGLAKLKHNK